MGAKVENGTKLCAICISKFLIWLNGRTTPAESHAGHTLSVHIRGQGMCYCSTLQTLLLGLVYDKVCPELGSKWCTLYLLGDLLHQMQELQVFVLLPGMMEGIVEQEIKFGKFASITAKIEVHP